jgi:hypothetical protein
MTDADNFNHRKRMIEIPQFEISSASWVTVSLGLTWSVVVVGGGGGHRPLLQQAANGGGV